jgi:hypothetical protein
MGAPVEASTGGDATSMIVPVRGAPGGGALRKIEVARERPAQA